MVQASLYRLKQIVAKHGTGIGNLATRWVLDRPEVAGIIVGARHADRLPENFATFGFTLAADDRKAIGEILAQRRGTGGRCGWSFKIEIADTEISRHWRGR